MKNTTTSPVIDPQQFSLERVELLKKRLLEKAGATRKRPRMVKANEGDKSLSFSQERLWFLWQLDPDSAAQNRPTCFRISGAIQEKALESALNEIQKRHEVLRSLFSSTDGVQSVRVNSWKHWELAVTDLCSEPSEAAEVRLREIAAERIREPFDLERGPLMRADLIRLGGDQHILILVFHHIIFDAWSGERLVSELAQLYDGFSSGKRIEDRPNTYGYADFANWQRRMLGEGFWEEDVRYWKQELGGSLPILNLPAVSSTRVKSAGFGHRRSFVISSSLASRLTELGRAERATLFMVLLAAYKVMLFRCSDQEDLIVGCPVSGRTEMETEHLLGCFINTLAIRNRIDGNISFQTWLHQVRDKCLLAYRHQGLPLEKIVEIVNPTRSLSHNPIFQTLFNFRNIPPVTRLTSDVVFTPWEETSEWITDFGLSLEVASLPEGLRATWVCRDGLFTETELCEMAASFQNLLEGIVSVPTKSVMELSLEVVGQDNQYLKRWRERIPRSAGEVAEPEAARMESVSSPISLASILASLTEIWERVLNIHPVRMDQNFFALGGHSILALRLVSQINKAFRLDLGVPVLFEHPTIGKIAEVIQSSASFIDTELLTEIPRLARNESAHESVFPAAHSQSQLWFVEEMEPGTAGYNIARSVKIRGSVNREALQQSLDLLVHNHEALRTTFSVVKGVPSQVIKSELSLRLEAVSVEGSSVSEREAEIRRLCRENAAKPFDLKNGPIVRATLFRLNEQEDVLQIVLHHIVVDGWSLVVLFRDLEIFYAANKGGLPAPILKSRLDFADYSSWQQGNSTAESLSESLRFWKRQLSGIPTVLDLPTDHPRVPGRMRKSGRITLELDACMVSGLRTVASRHESSLFMVLLSSFQILLSRYSGQSKLAIGVPFLGRSRPETKNLVGMLANILPISADLSKNVSFLEFLTQVRQTMIESEKHCQTPFSMLVRELNVISSPDINPIFQTTFTYVHSTFGVEAEYTSEWEPFESLTETGKAKFDLALNLSESNDKVEGTLDYDATLFDPETIRRWVESFQVLLADVSQNPNKTVRALSLLNGKQRIQILESWNGKETDYPRTQAIHEIFRAQALQTPNAPAIQMGDQILSYSDLDSRSDKYSQYLVTQGVGLDVVVGLYVDRSLDMIIALLAILKAGGAYLALDPEYPDTRVSRMLSDARPVAVLTNGRLESRISCLEKAMADGAGPVHFQIINLEELERSDKYSGGSAAIPSKTGNGASIAYVSYTSGSTGQPKGIQIPHRGVIRLVKGTDYASFSKNEVFLQLASLAFDASTFEIWGPLLNGGKLVLMPPGISSLEEIGRAIKKYEVTTLWLTAGLFHAMVEERIEDLLPLRQLLAGGDILSVSAVKKVREKLPLCRLINGYGPTESTTFACCHTVKETESLESSVPIGKPIANTLAYIMDSEGEPLPIGVVGELLIGGDGLARGYLNDPELTAQKFIPNPFRNSQDARLYRTGDLARFLPSGNIEFIGRVDHQVKIRGFRVEPAELEVLLATHTGVREAAVVVRKDRRGDRILVAYFVRREASGPSIAELREFVRGNLPDYMVPTGVVALDSMPLNGSGKVDRQLLPEWSPEEANAQNSSTLPSTPTEMQLTQIWQHVFGMERIGSQQSFFELGGHSLLAVRLISEVNLHFDCELSVLALFQNPTVQQLALAVQEITPANREPALLTLQEGEGGLPLYFLDAETQHCRLASLLDKKRSIYTTQVPLPIHVLEAAAKNQLQQLPSMEEMAVAHANLIAQHLGSGSCVLGGHCYRGSLSFEVARLLAARGIKVTAVLLFDTPIWEPRGYARIWDWVKKEPPKIVREKLQYVWRKANSPIASEFAKVKKRLSAQKEVVVVPENIENRFTHVPWTILSSIQKEASKNYHPKPLRTRGIFFLSEEMEPLLRQHQSSRRAGRLFSEGIEIVKVPGAHLTMLREPHVRKAAEQLDAALTRLRTN